MIRISKILLGLTIVLLALWQLPWCYAFFNTSSTSVPFTLYSGIHGDFITITTDKEKKMIGIDSDSTIFTQEETDSLLPFFYSRQLVTDGRLPDSILGRPVNPRDIQMTNFNFRSTAAALNAPTVDLYFMLESMSKRVELEMPEDVFRINSKGIEFINMNTNSIEVEKSEKFTKAMQDKNFKFPARLLHSNPTVKKDYDEGYLLVDNAGQLFHMKQMQGRPYVRHIELPEGLDIKHVFITEFRDRKTLGFIVDQKNQFYVLNNKTYELFNTGISDCDLDNYDLIIIGNMADWTLWLTKDNCREFYALDANSYSIIKKTVKHFENPSIFGLHFTDGKDYFVYPRF